jgi:hypothetical protein
VHYHDIDDESLRRAEERLSGMKIYELSHRREAANRVGALGEVVFERWLEANDIHYTWLADTRFDYRIAGQTVEVKTKDRSVRPLARYEASVPDYNVQHQSPDWYAFLSLVRERSDGTLRDYRRAYLVGISRAADYHAIAERRETGEVDPRNGTRFWTACWNVSHVNLGSPSAVARYWKAFQP